MITWIKVFALLLSVTGYILYAHKKGVALSLAPVISVSIISIVIFLAGVLNVMGWTAKLLFFLGLVFLFLSLHKSPPQKLLQKETLMVLLFFGLLNLFLFCRLRNVQMIHYDNFSHWLLVVRDMLREDRLPNFTSTMIEFQAYPTGTAGFIYFVCRVIGDSEGCILFGQAMIMAACLCVFWGFARKSYLVSGLVIGGISLFLLIYNIGIANLPVDSVLALVGIASFAALVYYREDLSKAAPVVGIIGCFLMLVKNSGIFYVALHGLLLLAFYVYDIWQKKDAFSLKKSVTLAGFSLGAPLLTFLLWNQHVEYAFPAGDTSKHSMSVANYSNIFGEKSPEQVLEILDLFLERITDPRHELTIFLILGTAYLAFLLLSKIAKSGRTSTVLYFAVWSLFSHVIYIAGLAAMYLLSMPYVEAITLGGFDRYLNTQLMYLMGIAAIYFLMEVSRSPKAVSATAAVAVITMCVVVFNIRHSIPGLLKDRSNFYGMSRGILQSLHYEHEIPNGQRYCIIGTWDYGYLYYLGKYEFWSNDVTGTEVPKAEDYPEFFEDFDYLIIVEEKEGTKEFLADLGLPYGQQVYCLADYQ